MASTKKVKFLSSLGPLFLREKMLKYGKRKCGASSEQLQFIGFKSKIARFVIIPSFFLKKTGRIILLDLILEYLLLYI